MYLNRSRRLQQRASLLPLLILICACHGAGAGAGVEQRPTDTSATATGADGDTRAGLDTHREPPRCIPQVATECTVGVPILDFSVEDCEGNRWTPQELLRSHEKVLLYFSATWFDPIGSEPIETLNEWTMEFGETIRFVVVLREEYGGFGESTPDLCRSFSARKAAKMLVLIDPEGTLSDACLTPGIPTAVAIDCEGIVYLQSEALPAYTPGIAPI